MKNHHNLKIGQIGFYEGKECEIDDFVDEITLEISGMFGKYYYWDSYYKNRLHKFFRIKTKFLKEVEIPRTFNISFWNFKPIEQKTEKQLAS